MAHPGPSRPRAPDIPIHPRPRMAPAPVKILRGAAEQEKIRLGKRRTNVGRPREFDPAIIAESGFLLANSDVVDKKRLFKFFGIKPESRAGIFPTYNFLDERLPQFFCPTIATFRDNVLRILPCLGVQGTRNQMLVWDETVSAETWDLMYGLVADKTVRGMKNHVSRKFDGSRLQRSAVAPLIDTDRGPPLLYCRRGRLFPSPPFHSSEQACIIGGAWKPEPAEDRSILDPDELKDNELQRSDLAKLSITYGIKRTDMRNGLMSAGTYPRPQASGIRPENIYTRGPRARDGPGQGGPGPGPGPHRARPGPRGPPGPDPGPWPHHAISCPIGPWAPGLNGPEHA